MKEHSFLDPAPKKKASTGKAKGLPNGSIGHNTEAMSNGTHCSRSALNGKHSEEEDHDVPEEAEIQRVHPDSKGEALGPVDDL